MPVRAFSRPGSQGDGPGTQYPCRPIDDSLAQLKAALAAAPPAGLLDDLPQLPKAVRELVLDRIEAAMYERRVVVDCDLYAALLMALMPAEFDIPDPPGRGRLGPTATAPKTRARELVYAARCRRAVALFHAADAAATDAVVLDQRWEDGRAPRVRGWAADKNRGRSGTVPGVSKKRKRKRKAD